MRDRAEIRANLDERQRQLRDRAMLLCYQVLSAVVVLGVAWVAIPVLLLGESAKSWGARN